MTKPTPHTRTPRRRLLEKALEEISIGDPEKAETYIELALAEETAAPELLDALIGILAWWDVTPCRPAGDEPSAFKEARAAIAKVEGGAA
jgi:hypothetical protein